MSRVYSPSSITLKTPCANFTGRSSNCRTRLSRRVHAFSQPRPENEPLELPGGGFWWLNKRQEPERLIYGDHFVIHRVKVGGPGLVKSPRSTPTRYRHPTPTPAPVHKARRPLGLIMSGIVVIDTEYEIIDPEILDFAVDDTINDNTTTVQPNTECVGIVPFENLLTTTEEGEDSDIEEDVDNMANMPSFNAKHPRRTQLLRFRCNLCGTSQQKMINPKAWQSGSVFARCEECEVVHKLIDNLNIFEECTEDGVFPPPNLRSKFLLKQTLDRIADTRAKNSNIKRMRVDIKKIVPPFYLDGYNSLDN